MYIICTDVYFVAAHVHDFLFYQLGVHLQLKNYGL